MAITMIRSIIIYFIVVILYRVMGKRQIGEMQPGELVLAIMISDIASVPMQSVSTPLVHGLVPILALMCIEVALSFFSQKSYKFRKMISGEPSLIVANGKILVQEMQRLRFNLDDLFEQLRNNGTFDISEVSYAVLETNGMLSILPKAQNRPATVEDLQNPAPADSYPVNIIKDGVLNGQALSEIGRDMDWLHRKLGEKNIKRIQDVFLLCADTQKVTFLQRRE